MRRLFALTFTLAATGCLQDFSTFEPSGGNNGGTGGIAGNGGSGGNQTGGGGNQTGGGGNQTGGGGNQTGGGGIGGMPNPCDDGDPSDCPVAADCNSAICNMGACDTAPLMDGVDCPIGMGVCLAGACVECIDAMDCGDPVQFTCMMNQCAPAGCGDGIQNNGEIGVDCGGPCPGCPNGTPCMNDVDCVSGFCNGANVCAACTQDNQCDLDDYCHLASGTCVPELVDGAACLGDFDCVSEDCVDGVCCNDPCGGECEACTQALTGQPDGQCNPILPANTPANECPANGGCQTGQCSNGVAACEAVMDGTSCGAGSCVNGTLFGGSSCNNGNCQMGAITSCAPYVCNAAGTQCLTSCMSAADCSNGVACDMGTGTCGNPNGTVCASGATCLTGNCVDNRCCDTACNGTCVSCNSATSTGADGVCSPIDANTDPQNECPGGACNMGNGAHCCNGMGACNP